MGPGGKHIEHCVCKVFTKQGSIEIQVESNTLVCIHLLSELVLLAAHTVCKLLVGSAFLIRVLHSEGGTSICAACTVYQGCAAGRCTQRPVFTGLQAVTG